MRLHIILVRMNSTGLLTFQKSTFCFSFSYLPLFSFFTKKLYFLVTLGSGPHLWNDLALEITSWEFNTIGFIIVWIYCYKTVHTHKEELEHKERVIFKKNNLNYYWNLFNVILFKQGARMHGLRDQKHFDRSTTFR